MSILLEQSFFYERLTQPGNEAIDYLQNPIMQKDIWNIKHDFPHLLVQAHIKGSANLYFQGLQLPWLKQLAKLAILVKLSTRDWGLGMSLRVLGTTKKFCSWLVERGYVMPSALRLETVQQWAIQAKFSQKSMLQMLLNVLYKLDCIPFQVAWKSQESRKHGEIISEDIKHQLDEAFRQFDAPIYLIFKLHAALATRSIELSKIPQSCLRQREGIMRIQIPTGKQDDSMQEQDLPEELVPLVEQQQAFVRKLFGDDFPWLFSNWHHKLQGHHPRWPPILVYRREQISQPSVRMNKLLAQLIKQNDIRTRGGQLAHVTTHQFRRTYGTVASRMGKRTDQIRHGLRHLNDDMQDAYVLLTPQEQEKKIKVFTNRNGQQIVYRTDENQEVLRREWQLRQTELGLCSRPSIIQDCEFEHICLGCDYAHYTFEHLPKLRKLKESNQQLLAKALKAGQSDSRRAHSARQQVNILSKIILQIEKVGVEKLSV